MCGFFIIVFLKIIFNITSNALTGIVCFGQLVILSKSSLGDEIVSTLDKSLYLVLIKLGFRNIVVECKMVSSSYESIELDVIDERSLIRIIT